MLRHVRRALLTRLTSAANLTAIVPVSSILPQAPLEAPEMPFVKLGASSALPRDAACLRGATVRFPVHAFSNGRREAGALVETAEDEASRIGEAIKGALHQYGADLPGGRMSVRIVNEQLLVDAEPGAMHWRGEAVAKVTA